MRIGCCAGLDQIEIITKIGYDYIELPLAKIMELSDQEFCQMKESFSTCGAKAEVCNIFFPAHIRLTGHEVDYGQITQYVDAAMARAAQVGADTIVFGSAGAKNVPAGFSRSKAWDQIVDLLKQIDKIAQKNRLTIAVEPLNKTESNIINTTREGLKLVREVDSEHIKLLIDYYHFSVGMEDLDSITEASSHLTHVHIARPLGRAYPTDIGEDSYQAFFDRLEKIKYSGRLSVEALTKDIETDAYNSLKFLKAIVR